MIIFNRFLTLKGSFHLKTTKLFFTAYPDLFKDELNSVLYAGIVKYLVTLWSPTRLLTFWRCSNTGSCGWCWSSYNLSISAQSLCLYRNLWAKTVPSIAFCFLGVAPRSSYWFLLYLVASYIEFFYVSLLIFNVLDDLDPNLINASYDLGDNRWDTFRHVVFPLSMNGVRSGVQSVFIQSESLHVDTDDRWKPRHYLRDCGIEQHFLTTQNWGMGSTIELFWSFAMLLTMWATEKGENDEKALISI